MKYIVWVKDRDENTLECYSVGRKWVPNGDGPVSQHTAERILREIQGNGVMARALPVSQTPIDL